MENTVDEKRKQLEEQWSQSQGEADEFELLRYLVETNQIDKRRIALACHLGHRPALLIAKKDPLPIHIGESDQLEAELIEWCGALIQWHKITCMRAAISAACVNHSLILADSAESKSALQSLHCAIVWTKTRQHPIIEEIVAEEVRDLRTSRIDFSLQKDPQQQAKREAIFSMRAAGRALESKTPYALVSEVHQAIVAAASASYLVSTSAGETEKDHIPLVLECIKNDLVPWALQRGDPLIELQDYF